MFARFIVTLGLAAAAGALLAQVSPPVRMGGVGEDERQALEADRRYNLKVVAANGAGQYLADVDVRVVDEHGARVVTAHMPGPWLLTELPPGRYRVVGIYGGATQSREVTVGRDARREVVLRWPDAPEGK